MHFYASSLHSLTVKVVCNPHDEAASAGALGQLPASFWRPGRLSTPAANQLCCTGGRQPAAEVSEDRKAEPDAYRSALL